MALFTYEEGIFKTKPTKGIVSIIDPNKSDLLDCEQLHEMTIKELRYLMSLLPVACLATLRVGYEIKVRTYPELPASTIRRYIVGLTQIHGKTMHITNVDLDKIEGREKTYH